METETLKTQERDNPSEAERVLGRMPEFFQRDSIVGKINSIAADTMTSEMNISSVKEYLCRINGAINGVDRSEMVESGEVIGAASGGADYVAPNKMVRGEIAEDYLEGISSEEDKNKKAELAYHAIIKMHLFEDGNGRTARATYLLIRNGKIGEEDSAFLEHGKDEKGSEDFESINSIVPSQTMTARATMETLTSEIEKGNMPNWLGDFVQENGPFSIHTYMQPAQEELISKGLNEDERSIIRDMFDDNYLAGYATAELLLEEDGNEETFKKNLVEPVPGICSFRRLTFTHSKKNSEKYNSVFGSMNAQQYRRLIDIYNNLKIEQNKKVIEIVRS